jgi:hypothetical protein
LQKTLYFPAISARRFNPTIQAFCERLSQRDKHTMTIVGAAMRKLLCLALGVLKSDVPFDPNYQSAAPVPPGTTVIVYAAATDTLGGVGALSERITIP